MRASTFRKSSARWRAESQSRRQLLHLFFIALYVNDIHSPYRNLISSMLNWPAIFRSYTYSHTHMYAHDACTHLRMQSLLLSLPSFYLSFSLYVIYLYACNVYIIWLWRWQSPLSFFSISRCFHYSVKIPTSRRSYSRTSHGYFDASLILNLPKIEESARRRSNRPQPYWELLWR